MRILHTGADDNLQNIGIVVDHDSRDISELLFMQLEAEWKELLVAASAVVAPTQQQHLHTQIISPSLAGSGGFLAAGVASSSSFVSAAAMSTIGSPTAAAAAPHKSAPPATSGIGGLGQIPVEEMNRPLPRAEVTSLVDKTFAGVTITRDLIIRASVTAAAQQSKKFTRSLRPTGTEDDSGGGTIDFREMLFALFPRIPAMSIDRLFLCHVDENLLLSLKGSCGVAPYIRFASSVTAAGGGGADGEGKSAQKKKKKDGSGGSSGVSGAGGEKSVSSSGSGGGGGNIIIRPVIRGRSFEELTAATCGLLDLPTLAAADFKLGPMLFPENLFAAAASSQGRATFWSCLRVLFPRVPEVLMRSYSETTPSVSLLAPLHRLFLARNKSVYKRALTPPLAADDSEHPQQQQTVGGSVLGSLTSSSSASRATRTPRDPRGKEQGASSTDARSRTAASSLLGSGSAATKKSAGQEQLIKAQQIQRQRNEAIAASKSAQLVFLPQHLPSGAKQIVAGELVPSVTDIIANLRADCGGTPNRPVAMQSLSMEDYKELCFDERNYMPLLPGLPLTHALFLTILNSVSNSSSSGGSSNNIVRPRSARKGGAKAAAAAAKKLSGSSISLVGTLRFLFPMAPLALFVAFLDSMEKKREREELFEGVFPEDVRQHHHSHHPSTASASFASNPTSPSKDGNNNNNSSSSSINAAMMASDDRDERIWKMKQRQKYPIADPTAVNKNYIPSATFQLDVHNNTGRRLHQGSVVAALPAIYVNKKVSDALAFSPSSPNSSSSAALRSQQAKQLQEQQLQHEALFEADQQRMRPPSIFEIQNALLMRDPSATVKDMQPLKNTNNNNNNNNSNAITVVNDSDATSVPTSPAAPSSSPLVSAGMSNAALMWRLDMGNMMLPITLTVADDKKAGTGGGSGATSPRAIGSSGGSGQQRKKLQTPSFSSPMASTATDSASAGTGKKSNGANSTIGRGSTRQSSRKRQTSKLAPADSRRSSDTSRRVSTASVFSDGERRRSVAGMSSSSRNLFAGFSNVGGGSGVGAIQRTSSGVNYNNNNSCSNNVIGSSSSGATGATTRLMRLSEGLYATRDLAQELAVADAQEAAGLQEKLKRQKRKEQRASKQKKMRTNNKSPAGGDAVSPGERGGGTPGKSKKNSLADRKDDDDDDDDEICGPKTSAINDGRNPFGDDSFDDDDDDDDRLAGSVAASITAGYRGNVITSPTTSSPPVNAPLRARPANSSSPNGSFRVASVQKKYGVRSIGGLGEMVGTKLQHQYNEYVAQLTSELESTNAPIRKRNRDRAQQVHNIEQQILMLQRQQELEKSMFYQNRRASASMMNNSARNRSPLRGGGGGKDELSPVPRGLSPPSPPSRGKAATTPATAGVKSPTTPMTTTTAGGAHSPLSGGRPRPPTAQQSPRATAKAPRRSSSPSSSARNNGKKGKSLLMSSSDMASSKRFGSARNNNKRGGLSSSSFGGSAGAAGGVPTEEAITGLQSELQRLRKIPMEQEKKIAVSHDFLEKMLTSLLPEEGGKAMMDALKAKAAAINNSTKIVTGSSSASVYEDSNCNNNNNNNNSNNNNQQSAQGDVKKGLAPSPPKGKKPQSQFTALSGSIRGKKA